MKKYLNVTIVIVLGLISITLSIGFLIGPLWTISCSIWGMILGYKIDYPSCFYPKWW